MGEQASGYEGWAVVEIMGHRRLGGYVRPERAYGTDLLRIDIPETEGGQSVTQYYGGGSIYALTPASEEAARAVARRQGTPEVVHPYEMPRPALPSARGDLSAPGWRPRPVLDDDDDGQEPDDDTEDESGQDEAEMPS